MQEALLRLTEYWNSRSCLISQPMNTEVGAGTFNPATVLRVLGPEPWKVAYVEPSVRPDDSRYGENPNRLQTHTQFQVILKPLPENPQELYLGSLQALGIDIAAHDIRFVEDNWMSPALGAWGLGWEVWLDGLEITQYTYFQQAGGITLEPVSLELTYGIERILMALQEVTHFKEIAYAPGISYGELFGQAEFEMSTYYLDTADIETNKQLFESYVAESQRQLDARLPVPAHSYLLKSSHAFNVLDSRKAIGVTERARAFARMATLAQQISTLWLERREEMSFPLGITPVPELPAQPSEFPEIAEPAPFVCEIGVEEIPASEVDRSIETVRTVLAEQLAETGLQHGEIKVVGTPRRIIAVIDVVQPREEHSAQTVRGPRASAAFDPSGAPTKAALGFARSQGIDVADLQRLNVDGGDYVGVVRQVAGRPAAQVLAGVLPEVVRALRAERNMRWGAPGLTFARPIRWILALLGTEVVPCAVSTLNSDRLTRVHRTAEHPVLAAQSAVDYLDWLATHDILADGVERQRRIVDSAQQLAADVGGVIDVQADAGVINEVTNLVEWPTAILGEFDRSYLSLPADVLITVMKKHQRYLPVRNAAGELLPYFVAVANGSCDQALVRKGNEAVLRARYEDAAFFWKQDLQVKPEDMKAGLTSLTFTDQLGSMADRAQRISALSQQFGELAGLSEDDSDVLSTAASLVKFDLTSAMVTELSSLAGVMAREYAVRAGYSESVATALFETELPRSAGDILPTSATGAVLSLADRLDLLAGLFAVGLIPRGSSDPFALRRAALGVLSVLRTRPELADLSISRMLQLAVEQQPIDVSAEAISETQQFIARRFSQQLLEAGYEHDLVQAIQPLADQPAQAVSTLDSLINLAKEPGFVALVQAIQRVRRIVPADATPACDPQLFDTDAERDLYQTLNEVRGEFAGREVSLEQFAAIAGKVVPVIDRFFVDVLVMAEDPAIRANRFGLLANLRDMAAGRLNWDVL